MPIVQGESTLSPSGSSLHRRWSDISDSSSSSSSRSSSSSSSNEAALKQCLEESSTFSSNTTSSCTSSHNNGNSISISNNISTTPPLGMQQQQQQQQQPLLSSSASSGGGGCGGAGGGFLTRLRLRKQHHHTIQQQVVPPNMPLQQELLNRHSSKDIKQNGSGSASCSDHHNNVNGANSNNAVILSVNWRTMSMIILVWYLVGVVAICTTKILLTDFNVPPLILTVQQLVTGSILLRAVLVVRDGGARPWPVVVVQQSNNTNNNDKHSRTNNGGTTTVDDVETAAACNNLKPEASTTTSSRGRISRIIQTIRWYIPEIATTVVPIDLILAGLFNSLDFLASNTAFSGSSASFVETIKASEPITTTAVALLWKIDHLNWRTEGASLGILVAGVLLTTVGNSGEEENSGGGGGGEETSVASLVEFKSELDESSMYSSSSSAASVMSFVTLNPATTAALTVMTANLCYAFRALSQKRFRAWEKTQQQQQQQQQHEENDHGHHQSYHSQQQQEGSMDDINLLMRMQQVGAMSLVIPAILSYGGIISNGNGNNGTSSGLWIDVMTAPTSAQLHYLSYAVVNTVAYVTYNLASTYVLTSLSVLQHSSLNCLRRMFCTVATSIFFGVTWSAMEALGVVLCFCGFLSFTHFRGQRTITTTTTTTTVSTMTISTAASSPPPVLLSPTSSANTIQMIST